MKIHFELDTLSCLIIMRHHLQLHEFLNKISISILHLLAREHMLLQALRRDTRAAWAHEFLRTLL